MRSPLLLSLALAPLLAIAAAVGACDKYEPPPVPVIEGLQGSVLSDAKAPLTIAFGKPIVASTMSVKVAYYETDLEGNLLDEDDSEETSLRILVSHDPLDGDRGGRTELAEGGTKLRIFANGSFPVGPKLVLIFEAGLAATDGKSRQFRTKIPFSYTVKCSPGAKAEKFPNGTYFVLLDVEDPLKTQIQLLANIEVDKGTGLFLGQFTNADRNPDGNRCSPPCGSSDACRLFPSQACVPPSTKAGTAEEWPDFVPNAPPPIGYSFTVEGCAVDDEKGSAVLTAPATMVVQSPPVTVAGLVMTAFFGDDGKGNVRGTGSLSADAVSLSDNVIGPGRGTMTATLIPADKVPPGVPAPPVRADAGTTSSPDASK